MKRLESLKNWMKEEKISRKKELRHWLVRGSTRMGMSQSDDAIKKLPYPILTKIYKTAK